MTAEPVPVTVLLDAGVPVGEESELKEALAAAGFDPIAKDLPASRSADTINALALMAIPLHAFLGAMGSRLAAEAYPKFKSGINRILKRQPPGSARPLVLQDTETGIAVLMEPGLPDDAYEAFRTTDFSAFKKGPVSWDRALGRWRSIADEADAAR